MQAAPSSSTSSRPPLSRGPSSSSRPETRLPVPVPVLTRANTMAVDHVEHQRSSAASLRGRSQSWSMRSSIPGVALPGTAHAMDEKSNVKLQREMDHAVKVVTTFFNPKVLKDQSIPKELIMEANGLVFLTVYKVGFLLSGKVGSGFIISRTTAGWSAPSFLSSGGIGFGMMAGGEVVNYMIVLNSRSAVKVFTRNGQVQLGSELDLAVGPIGRAASAALNVGRGGIAPNYSYSHSVGLYGGLGLSGAVICTRKSLNAKFYGPNVTVRQILGGDVACVHAVPLWRALDEVLGAERIYVDGRPVIRLATEGIVCDTCGFHNAMESPECDRCQSLLVYTVSVHSGKRSASQLVVSSDMRSAGIA